MRQLFALIILLATFHNLGAQTFSITGKLKTDTETNFDNATISLLKAKDSSIINYVSANKDGSFKINVKKTDEPAILTIFQEKLSSENKLIEKISDNINLGDIYLNKERVNNIEEVKLVAAPVKIKKDTIEFKASALKVRPDSKIDDLLKEIPGIEISNEGKITINGKEVDQIMINGKPFFDKDGKIALTNLPADIIKNIQITTTKTKEEELSGSASKSNNMTVNFNIDEKKNKGFLSRFTLGMGTDKRYESNLMLSYFKNDRKINLIAASNNINSQGFTNDEVFDSMGHGRNAWMMNGGSVYTENGNTYFSSGQNQNKGILQSTTVGFNYVDKIGKEVDLNSFSLLYTNTDLKTKSKADRTTLLPDNNFNTNSNSEGNNKAEQFGFDTAVRIKPDAKTSIYFNPSYSVNTKENRNLSSSQTTSNGGLSNMSNANTYNKTVQQSFSPNLYFNRKFKKEGRSISANINTNMSDTKSDDTNISSTIFYQTSDLNDTRNQQITKKTNTVNNSYAINYSEPILDSVKVITGIRYQASTTRNNRTAFDFNTNSNDYSVYNDLISNAMRMSNNGFIPHLGFEIEKKKFNIWADANLKFSTLKLNSTFQNNQFFDKRNLVLPDYYVGGQYNFTDSKNIYFSVGGNSRVATLEQLIPVYDYSNPLVVTFGNPNLKTVYSQYANFYFSNFIAAKNINFYINSYFNYSNNSIVNVTSYDASGKQFTTYTNVDGNKYLDFGSGFTKTFKWKDIYSLSINPNVNLNYNFMRGFINAIAYTSHLYALSPGLSLSYEIKDKFTIKPSYHLNYNFSEYKNYSIGDSKGAYHQLKMQVTNYILGSKIVFGNDFEYNSNSAISAGFKQDFYLWNTSLGYSFWKKQLTAKVKVFDVLNQNQAIRRNITSTYIEDREDLILRRYVMFSLSLKLNKFGDKKGS